MQFLNNCWNLLIVVRISLYVNIICLLLLTYVNNCKLLLTFSRICYSLLIVVNIYYFLLSVNKNCQYLRKLVNICQRWSTFVHSCYHFVTKFVDFLLTFVYTSFVNTYWSLTGSSSKGHFWQNHHVVLVVSRWQVDRINQQEI